MERTLYRNLFNRSLLVWGDRQLKIQLEEITTPELAEDIATYDVREEAIWKCCRCLTVNEIKTKSVFHRRQIITPFIYRCRTCEQQIFYFRGPEQEEIDNMDQEDWWNYPGEWDPKGRSWLYRRFVGAYEVINETDFRRKADPHKNYGNNPERNLTLC